MVNILTRLFRPKSPKSSYIPVVCTTFLCGNLVDEGWDKCFPCIRKLLLRESIRASRSIWNTRPYSEN